MSRSPKRVIANVGAQPQNLQYQALLQDMRQMMLAKLEPIHERLD